MVRKTPDMYIDIKLDLDEFDVTKSEMKPTYDDIKRNVLDKFGLKVSTLFISHVKRKLGLEVGESYNKQKIENTRQPQCPPEKEKAIGRALEYLE